MLLIENPKPRRFVCTSMWVICAIFTVADAATAAANRNPQCLLHCLVVTIEAFIGGVFVLSKHKIIKIPYSAICYDFFPRRFTFHQLLPAISSFYILKKFYSFFLFFTQRHVHDIVQTFYAMFSLFSYEKKIPYRLISLSFQSCIFLLYAHFSPIAMKLMINPGTSSP